MRNARFLLGLLGLVACSLDHVRLAALDEVGSANVGGAPASAGSSSLGASAPDWGGAPPQATEDRFVLISGGSNVDVRIGADAGAPSVIVCSCLGGQAQVCGSDGVTYPAPCDDEGACLAPSIACFHACPCVDEMPGN